MTNTPKSNNPSFEKKLRKVLPDFIWKYDDIRKTRKEYQHQQGWNHCCEHIKDDSILAISKLVEEEVKRARIDEL